MARAWTRERHADGTKHAYDAARIERVRAEGKCSQCRSRPARPARRECALCAKRRRNRDHLRRHYGIPLSVIRQLELSPAPAPIGELNADR